MPKKEGNVLSYNIREWADRAFEGVKRVGHLRLQENLAYIHHVIRDDILRRTGHKEDDYEMGMSRGGVAEGLRYCTDGTFKVCLNEDGKIKTNNYSLALDVVREIRIRTGRVVSADVVKKLAEANVVTYDDFKYMIEFDDCLKKMSPQMLSQLATTVLEGDGSLPKIDLKEFKK